MPKKPLPKRYYNIRIDEITYKKLYEVKPKKQPLIDFIRELVLGSYF